MATDIFINDVYNEKGWHLGEPLHYEVNNCEWKSLVKVFMHSDRAQHNELIVQPYYLSGDKEKMIKDSKSLNIALQSYIGQQYKMVMHEIIEAAIPN
jgi:hypothetical protein